MGDVPDGRRMMVGDHCWHVRGAQPAAARSSATRSSSPAKNTTSSKPPPGPPRLLPSTQLWCWQPPGPGPRRRQTASASGDRDALAVPRLVPRPNPGCGRSDWWGRRVAWLHEPRDHGATHRAGDPGNPVRCGEVAEAGAFAGQSRNEFKRGLSDEPKPDDRVLAARLTVCLRSRRGSERGGPPRVS